MKIHSVSILSTQAIVLGILALAVSLPAHADNVWTYWSANSSTPGNPGTAVGSLDGNTVTYSGQFSSLDIGYPSWGPVPTFTTAPPPSAGGIIHMQGGSGLAESIIFSTPVLDPLIAIWSLGAPGDTASFVFTGSEPFSVIAGGPSAEYGGQSITQIGNGVDGTEGNGVIQFIGTYSEIDFTTPAYENWYGFTVGENTTPPPPTPEPGSLSLLGLGLGALLCFRNTLLRGCRT
jgi:hypothetical protein